MASHSCSPTTSCLARELDDADGPYHMQRRADVHEIAELRQEIIELRLSHEDASANAAAVAAGAMDKQRRDDAAAAAAAAAAQEAIMKREMHAAAAAQEAVRRAHAMAEQRTLIEAHDGHVAEMTDMYEAELEGISLAMINESVEAVSSRRALIALEAASSSGTERSADEKKRYQSELTKTESLLDQVRPSPCISVDLRVSRWISLYLPTHTPFSCLSHHMALSDLGCPESRVGTAHPGARHGTHPSSRE